MRLLRAFSFVVLGAPALAGAACSDAGPIAPATGPITLSVAVSGGLAGTDYGITVDGPLALVRGDYCINLCDFTSGEVLLGLSEGQLQALAELVDISDVMHLDGRDFGSLCCDQLHLQVSVERGGRVATVRGSGDTFPLHLANLVGRALALSRGVLPVRFVGPGGAAGLADAPLRVDSAQVAGLEVALFLTHGGGCELHRYDAVFEGEWMESFPVQTRLHLVHDDANDPCDAVVRTRLVLDAGPLAEAYRAIYGTGPASLIVHVEPPGGGAPGTTVTLDLP